MCCQGSNCKGGMSDFSEGRRAVAILRGGGNLNGRHILHVSTIWGTNFSADGGAPAAARME
eukprot:12902935-Prorocentrum_lima.AAC.1